MDKFTKIVCVGTYRHGTGAVFCNIQWDGAHLSITGVEGPKRNGNASGGCGQIGATLVDNVDTYATGWSTELATKFASVWAAWHLNDMRAGCEHQRAAGWDEKPIDPAKPTFTYGKHFAGQRYDSWNLLGWVPESEHQEGLMGRPCPECGYRYGTAWLAEEVPGEILEFLASLPDTDRDPVWV